MDVERKEQLGLDARIKEYVDNHGLMTYFLIIEVVLVFTAWYFDTWVSFTLTPEGPDLSDIVAGLLGGWAVVFALIGLIGVGLLVLSRLWLKIRRRRPRAAN